MMWNFQCMVIQSCSSQISDTIFKRTLLWVHFLAHILIYKLDVGLTMASIQDARYIRDWRVETTYLYFFPGSLANPDVNSDKRLRLGRDCKTKVSTLSE
jgi:hypothetical protein